MLLLLQQEIDMVSFTQNSATVHFTEPGEKDIQFMLVTASKPGKAVIKVEAVSGAEKATYNLEIEVRSPNPPESRAEMKVLQPGEKFEKSFLPFGIEGTAKAMVEVFSLPSINLSKRLGYLTTYPHGCYRTDYLRSLSTDLSS